MRHYDEGDMNAYLDGELDATAAEAFEAHVQACPACAGRLDATIQTWTLATELLDAAQADHVEAPPWSDLVARAALDGIEAEPDDQPTAPEPPTLRRRAVPLAWAATLALAFTLGWQANRLGLFDATSPALDEAMSAPAPARAREADAVAADDSRREFVEDAASPAAELPSAEEVEVAAAESAAADPVEASANQPAATGESADAPPAVAAAEPPRQKAREVAPPERLQDQQLARVPQAGARLAEDPAPAAEREARANRADFDALEAAPRALDPAEAEALLGVAPLDLAGARRLSIEAGPAPGGGPDVAVWQWFALADGRRLAVIEQPVVSAPAEGSDSARFTALAGGEGMLEFRRVGRPTRGMLRGPATEAELRELLGRLRDAAGDGAR